MERRFAVRAIFIRPGASINLSRGDSDVADSVTRCPGFLPLLIEQATKNSYLATHVIPEFAQ